MRLKRASVLLVTAGALLAVAVVAVHELPRSAEAQLGGYSQVSRLEIRYEPTDDVVTARFHLATGVVLSETVDSGPAADRLFQAAAVYAQGGVRMFVAVKSDRVTSWSLSLP